MIRILFFIPDLSGGGAEKVLCNLVNNMNQEKFDITVHTLYPYNSELFLKKGIHYKSVLHSKSKWSKELGTLWYRFLTAIGLMYPLYIKSDYDIEVAYLECGATKVLAQSTNKNAKKIAWVHCNVQKKGLTKEKVGKYYKKYDHVICVSGEGKASFDIEFGKFVESSVLYNVIDENEINNKLRSASALNWNHHIIHLVTIGRLCYEKGSDRIVKICRLLKDRGFQFQFHLVGDGIDRKAMENDARNYGLSDEIVFENFQLNPYPYMKNADIIVIPSRTEALSTVAIESMILGKPVVTTPCAGMHEMFDGTKAAIITEDNVESIVDNICSLMANKEMITQMSSSSGKRGNDFKKDVVVKKTENFFENICDF